VAVPSTRTSGASAFLVATQTAGCGGDFGANPVANFVSTTPSQALCYDGIGATLYFSTLGVGSFSPLLPCIGFSWFVTFGPICKESLVKIPTDATDKDIPGKQLR
jgi:hypothetical protein